MSRSYDRLGLILWHRSSSALTDGSRFLCKPERAMTPQVDLDAKLIRHCEESRMYSSLTAVVLCIFSQVALAQCVDSSSAALDPRPDAELARTRTALAPAAGIRTGKGELITTAAAGTHDAPALAREVSAGSSAGEGESPRRRGPAMLLAALALMSGIALRRYGAKNQ